MADDGEKARTLVVEPVARVVPALLVEEAGYTFPIAGDPRSLVVLHGSDHFAVVQFKPLTAARPEDIFGSLEVDGNGKFVGDNGNYQASGMIIYL